MSETPKCYFCGCTSFKPFNVAECIECGIINHGWDSEYTGRAPLTPADAMTLPEVQALALSYAILAGPRATEEPYRSILAPFLPTMSEDCNE